MSTDTLGASFGLQAPNGNAAKVCLRDDGILRNKQDGPGARILPIASLSDFNSFLAYGLVDFRSAWQLQEEFNLPAL